MFRFFNEKDVILAQHNTKYVSLVFTMGDEEGLEDMYKLTALVHGYPAMIDDREFLPSVYMEEELFQEYSRLMKGPTSDLIIRLKKSCYGKGESLYRMATLLENDLMIIQMEKNVLYRTRHY